MTKIPLAPIFEKKFGISKMKSKEELRQLIDRLRSEDSDSEATETDESD